MRILKKILLIIGVIIALILIGGWMYFNSLKPDYSGEISLSSIENETSVYFDDYGIPHIYAQNQYDATTALGYVHAQDRLWQMELMRRIAPGRLSEIFGKDMLKNDQFVNQFIENGPTPIEFTLIGIEKEPYQLNDIYNILGYMSFSFAMAQKTDPLLSILKEKLGDDYLKELNIEIGPNTTFIKNSKENQSLKKGLNMVLKNPLPQLPMKYIFPLRLL